MKVALLYMGHLSILFLGVEHEMSSLLWWDLLVFDFLTLWDLLCSSDWTVSLWAKLMCHRLYRYSPSDVCKEASASITALISSSLKSALSFVEAFPGPLIQYVFDVKGLTLTGILATISESQLWDFNPRHMHEPIIAIPHSFPIHEDCVYDFKCNISYQWILYITANEPHEVHNT